MSGWYSITPAGTVAIGNLTPVGQNSGQVGCRWPPNGHHLAACLNLPSNCQIWGPFWWYAGETDIYVTLPLPVYRLESKTEELPQEIFRLQWRDQQWQVRSEHQTQPIEIIGGKYLISGYILKVFWQAGKFKNPLLKKFPWETLTLSHNSREDFQVKDEGGFFAEMTTLMLPRWSILVKVIGDCTLPDWGFLGAGGTPVAIAPVKEVKDNWLTVDCTKSTGAVLLTGALWQRNDMSSATHCDRQVSCPVPPFPIKAYAADTGVPWQSWKRVRDRHDPEKRVSVLTPGEWMTPAGAVYLWEGTVPLLKSEPVRDSYNRHVLGYGHLWLFQE